MFQWPAVGTGLLIIGTSRTTGLLNAIAFSKGRFEFGGSINSYALNAVGPGNGGVIGRSRLPVLFENGTEGRVEMGLLQTGNGAEGVVVHDQPDNGNVFMPGRRQQGRILTKSAITDQGDDHLVGLGDLGADGCRPAESHGGIAAGIRMLPG